MTNLSNQQINQSFKGILQIPGGITDTLQWVQDGEGNQTGLQLSTTSTGTAVDLSSINIGTTGSITDHIEPHQFWLDGYTSMGIVSGSVAAPDISKNPTGVLQKYTQYDSGSYFDQQIGALFGEVYVKGSGVTGTTDIDGTWVGITGNAFLNGQNQGSSIAPDYDAYGSTIGVAGFARSNGYPGSGTVITGIWGYPTGPVLDNTTWSNLPSTNWSLVGSEVNIQINHPDIGEKSVLAGKGSSVGYLAVNYRTPNSGVIDWTFGMVLNGTPNDGNYGNTNVDDWNGFYTGLLVDKIKAKGIRFGQYFKNNSYGIYFPDSYAGSQEPAAAIYLGNSKFNLGQYVGTNFNNQDFWHNAGSLFFKYNNVTGRVLQEYSGNVKLSGNTTFAPSSLPSLKLSASALAVNYFETISSASGNTPALAVIGDDTNIDIELRAKGTGKIWIGSWTTNADTAVNGYITVKDSSGVIRKIATIA